MDEFLQQAARAAHNDQAASAQRELARMVANYWHELVKQGLPRRAALELTQEWQAFLLTVRPTPPAQ